MKMYSTVLNIDNNNNNNKMFVEQQISMILEGFLKDHVTLNISNEFQVVFCKQ